MGQDGQYLKQLLDKSHIEVFGYSRNSKPSVDVTTFMQVETIIKKNNPDFIFHLAANSTTRHNALFENHETISTGTLNILEAAYRHCPTAKIFITGSGVQFKNTGEPISENSEFEGNSPYSVARIQSVYAARYYRGLGLKVYVGFLFHHESPLRKPNHISKLIAEAVKRIAKGSTEKIELGDISVKKEWTFAGDVVNGIFTLMQQDKYYEAAIGSGLPYSIEDWLKVCFNNYHLDWTKYIQLKDKFVPEYKLLVSNPSLIKSLGWQPLVSFNHLAKMMLDYE